LQVTLRKEFSHSVAGHFNYTWSHALDDVSNGGVTGFIQDSVLAQLTPTTLTTNYGNADYDIRHVFTADFIYTPKFKTAISLQTRSLADGRSGPRFFTIPGCHSPLSTTIPLSETSVTRCWPLRPARRSSFRALRRSCSQYALSDLRWILDSNAATFNAYPGISAQTRNQFRGPGYFGLDMNLYRVFPITERIKFNLGMTGITC